MSDYVSMIEKAADYLLLRAGVKPRVGVVLGSGWGGLLTGVEGAVKVPYQDVPGMKRSTVVGHQGAWIFGHVNGQPCAIMSGRLHYYEGHDLKDVTFPVRVMKAMGIEVLILTNAAGAVNVGFNAGDLMLITDHINFTGANPLFGANEDCLGPRFPDMSRAYDQELLGIARAVAREQAFPVREGVYAWFTGPSFETPAEIKMARAMGADAVGMSTVPETIVARHAGMRVLAASCATNMAAGVTDQPLSHEEVMQTAARVEAPFKKFLFELIGRV